MKKNITIFVGSVMSLSDLSYLAKKITDAGCTIEIVEAEEDKVVKFEPQIEPLVIRANDRESFIEDWNPDTYNKEQQKLRSRFHQKRK